LEAPIAETGRWMAALVPVPRMREKRVDGSVYARERSAAVPSLMMAWREILRP
jgi:hypothetical protein